MEFNLYAVPPIIASIISLITGIIILKQNRRSELYVVWASFLFMISIWTIGEFGIRLSGTGTDKALYWHNILILAGGGFIACFFFHFSLVFPTRHKLMDHRYIILPLVYGIMGAFYINALVRGWGWDESALNIVGDSYTRESLTRMVAQEAYYVNMFYIAALTFFGIVILTSTFNKLKGTPQQAQIGIVIFATIFFMGTGFFTDVLFPIVNISTLELASVGALATAITVAFVILKFNWVDIELITEKIEMGRLDDWLEKFKLHKGFTYLIPEKVVDLSFKLFAREVSNGAHGLVITAKEDPLEVKRFYNLRKIPIIWIGKSAIKNKNNIKDPTIYKADKGGINEIQELIEKFLVKSTNSVIFLEDLDEIYDAKTRREHRQALLNSAKATFKLINDYNSRFIISLNPDSLNLAKSRALIRTKSPILEIRLLTIFILEEVCQQLIEALEMRVGTERIEKKFHWLKSTDPFFLNMEFKNDKIEYTEIIILFRDDLVKKIKIFISAMRSLDRTLDLDSIALRILIKYGFSKYEYSLQMANTYLVDDKNANISFDIFQEFVESGYEGMLISKTNPKKILEKYGLNFNQEHTYWLTDLHTKSGNVLSPKLESIFSEIEYFIESTPRKKIVILDGVEYLISYSGDIFDSVLGFLRKLTDRISESDACLLIPMDFKALNEQRITLLTRSGLEIYTTKK